MSFGLALCACAGLAAFSCALRLVAVVADGGEVGVGVVVAGLDVVDFGGVSAAEVAGVAVSLEDSAGDCRPALG